MPKFISLSDLAGPANPKPATITIETNRGFTVHVGDGKWTHLRKRRDGSMKKEDIPPHLIRQARRVEQDGARG